MLRLFAPFSIALSRSYFCLLVQFSRYRVMQSDRNTLKTDTFHEPTNYEPRVSTSSEQIITITFIN